MGSSMYASLRFRGRVLGLVALASQVRQTYAARDLMVFEILAAHDAACWIAHGGGAVIETASRCLIHRPAKEACDDA